MIDLTYILDTALMSFIVILSEDDWLWNTIKDYLKYDYHGSLINSIVRN